MLQMEQNLKALVSDEMFDRTPLAHKSSRLDSSLHLQQNEIFATISEDEARSELLRDRITSDLLRFLGDDVYDNSRGMHRGSSSTSASAVSRVHAASTSFTRTPSNSYSSSYPTSVRSQFSTSREYSIPGSIDTVQQQHQRLLELLQQEDEARGPHLDLHGDGCCSDSDEDSHDDDDGIFTAAEDDSKTHRVVVLLTVSAMLVPWILFAVLFLSGEIAEIPGALRAVLNCILRWFR